MNPLTLPSGYDISILRNGGEFVVTDPVGLSSGTYIVEVIEATTASNVRKTLQRATNLATGETLSRTWATTGWTAFVRTVTNSAGILGINATASDTNRLAVASDSVTLSHDNVTPGSGDMRQVLNKSGAAKTVSQLYQSNGSARAEIGLTGDDNWHVKVSPDGAVWKEALIVDRTNGWLGIGGHAPAAPVHIVGPGGGVNPVVEANNESASAIGLDAWRSRGTFAAKTALVDGDAIMANRAYGHDGTSYVTAANLRASVDGAPSAGNVPGKWMFATHTTGVGLTNKLVVRSSGASEPGSDNAYTLGSSSARWSVVYAATGTINTSDARDKDIVSDLAFASAMVDTVEPVLYRWKVGGNEMRASATETMIDDDGMVVPKIDVVASPGRRLHAGFRAQDVKAAMDAVGVDFGAWGLDDKSDPDSRQWMRPDQLIPVLWQALKETRAELRALSPSVAQSTETTANADSEVVSAADVRAEASRRMQEIVGARDAEHLMIMQMKAHEEAIELLDKLYANKAMTTAEMIRIAELRTLRSVFQEIRDASNALETDPPLDYREDKYWTLDGRVSTSEGWFTGIWGYITSKITGNK